MKMRSKEGNIMMDAQTLRREGDTLIMKGKIMGSMNMSVYIDPKDIWDGKALLSWSVLWYMPIIIFKGWWKSMKLKMDR